MAEYSDEAALRMREMLAHIADEENCAASPCPTRNSYSRRVAERDNVGSWYTRPVPRPSGLGIYRQWTSIACVGATTRSCLGLLAADEMDDGGEIGAALAPGV